MDAGTAGSLEQEVSLHEYQVKTERDEKIHVVSCYPCCELQPVCSEIAAQGTHVLSAGLRGGRTHWEYQRQSWAAQKSHCS